MKNNFKFEKFILLISSLGAIALGLFSYKKDNLEILSTNTTGGIIYISLIALGCFGLIYYFLKSDEIKPW